VFFSKRLPLGYTAPSFHLLDTLGKTTYLSDFSERHGVALLFFASHWLPGDRKLLKRYAEAYAAFRAENVEVLAISSTDWERLYFMARELNLPFPVLFDPCARTSKQYGVMSIPRFVTGRGIFALNGQGKVLLARPSASPDDVLQAIHAASND
jgi:peroxiredoxin